MNSFDYLIERIKRSPEVRAKFVASHVDKNIAYQIRSLRDRQNLSQEDLAAKVDMNQNAISRLESPERGRPTITTLKRLAAAFDVALVVRFVPFSKLVKWVSGTPYVEEGLSTDSLATASFDEELRERAFEARAIKITPKFIGAVLDEEPERYATNIALAAGDDENWWRRFMPNPPVETSERTVTATGFVYAVTANAGLLNNFHQARNSPGLAPLELVARQLQERPTNA